MNGNRLLVTVVHVLAAVALLVYLGVLNVK
jgi:hypothetical protein